MNRPSGLRASVVSLVALVFAVFCGLFPAQALAAVVESSADAIEFVYVDQSSVEAGSEQNIVVGLVDDAEVSSATLVLGVDGKKIELDSSATAGGAALFSASFDDEGAYELQSLMYTLEGSDDARVVDLSDSDHGFEIVSAGSGAQLQSSCEEPSVTFTSIDADGNTVESSSMSDVLAAAASAFSGASLQSDASGNIVVCIDPGHGGKDGGTSKNGLTESVLTLKIARYMRDELLEYQGVSVVMTRDSDIYVGLDERSIISKNANADFFVSIHINAGGGTGAEVWIPSTATYYYEFHDIGTTVGNSILTKFQALGLKSRGLQWDNYLYNGSKIYYPDGSRQDAYSVIRNNRLNGIPAILVEHGFIDTSSDAAFLKSEANLKALGVADATAVAEYFNLSKEPPQDPQEEIAAPEGGVTIYRVYNRNSGLHHYTTSLEEVHNLQKLGWRSEGLAFYAGKSDVEGAIPVYRFYNENDGNHHWTSSEEERDMLVEADWTYEGIGWYQSAAATTDVYRLYNPNSGEHHYTTSLEEYESVIEAGWTGEGKAWKSL